MKPVRIAIIGEVTIDQHGELTDSGTIAAALAAIPGTAVTLRAVVPDAAQASLLTNTLHVLGVRAEITSRAPQEEAGPIRRGDTLDIWDLFAHDVVILDFADAGLRHFLTDLPAHTKPDVRLLGTLRAVQGPTPSNEREVALRCDTLVGNDIQFQHLMGTTNGSTALETIHAHLRGVNLRTAVMAGLRNELRIAALDEGIWKAQAERSPLPTLDHIVARVAVGMARREEWASIGRELTTGE